jgi:hypothetical protein
MNTICLAWEQVKAEQDNSSIEDMQKMTVNTVEHPTGGNTAGQPKDVPAEEVPSQKGSKPV